ncbi:uncharacterized protein BDV14DRAFT_200660 [Aspergillus stella-maris]|uniref:uncharacterized protein n=1 Tax=Aspergillus stella-maris TaxID=1810926 RepID=UPI003CCE1297
MSTFPGLWHTPFGNPQDESDYNADDVQDSEEIKPLLQLDSNSSLMPPTQDNSPAIHESSPKILSILIAGGDSQDRGSLVAEFKRRGHRVVAVDNGVECSQLYRTAFESESSRYFDVAFMGPNLDEVICSAATKMIHVEEKKFQRDKEGEGPRVPRIVVSESLGDYMRDELKDAGIDGWIRWPIDKELLTTILNGLHDTALRNRTVMEREDWLTGPGGWFKELECRARHTADSSSHRVG